MRAARVLAAALAGLGALAEAKEAPAPAERLREVEAARARGAQLLADVEARRRAVLDVVEEAERTRRAAEAAARKASKAVAAAEGAVRRAQADEAVVEGERRLAAEEVGPRLRLRYRLRGASYVQTLVTAPTLGDFLWRRRMVDRVLKGDLASLARLEETRRAAVAAREAVEAERAILLEAQAEAQAKAEVAEAEAEAQRALLAGLSRRKATHERTLAELERSREALLATLEALPDAAGGLGGFGARKGRLPRPVAGRVEVRFGRRVDPKFRTVIRHKGLDIRAERGAAVRAVHGANVGFAGWFKGYGNLVVLDHGEGYYTLYAHLDELAVEPGARVREGDTLGTVGDTGSLKGPYLYFEIRSGPKPLNPAVWLHR